MLSASCVTLEDHPLNSSDHLAINCTIKILHLQRVPPPAFLSQPLNWAGKGNQLHILKYANTTNEIIHPLLDKDYTSVYKIECDLQSVCKSLVQCAEAVIPKKKSSCPERLQDHTLSHLCWKSRCAFQKWKEAGTPRHGPIADEQRKCKK